MTDYTLEDTVYKRFTTRAFATNVPTTLAGTPVVSAYEDDSVTQITAGITLSIDHDGVIGLNLLTIVATAANGFESGKSYDFVVTTGTVDSVSHIGEVVWHFTLSGEAGSADRVLNAALSDYQTQGTVGAALTMAAYSGPHGPGVYIDDGAANTGIVLGGDGTIENPVSTIAAATTIASNLGVQTLYLINDTVITLVQTYEGFTFVGLGLNNRITLGSQDVDNSGFHNVILTGTQGGTGIIYAIGCSLVALTSAEIIAWLCWLSGDITLRAATVHIFKDCCSAVAGDETPDLIFPGSGTSNVNFRHYSGGLTLKSGTVNDTISYEVVAGQLIVDASCDSLTVRPRGILKVTDNGVNTNIELEAAINLTNIKNEVNTGLTDIGLDHLISASVTGADVADNSIIAKMVDDAATADWDGYDNATASLEALNVDADVLPGLISALNNISVAQIKSEVVDALTVDARAEPGQETPASNISMAAKIDYMFKQWRNKNDNDGSDILLYNEDGVTVDQRRSVSEVSGLVTKTEVVTGP